MRVVQRFPRAVALLVGCLYWLFYLYAIDNISLADVSVWQVVAGSVPWQQALRPRAMLLFEAVALIQAGPVVWLVSPVNLLIGATLSLLLAANIHGVLAIRSQPAQCRPARHGRAGVVGGGAPALLAGGACCAPSLLLLLGVPGLGVFAGYFAWLVPLSGVLLAGNRYWQRRQGAPPLLQRPGRPATGQH